MVRLRQVRKSYGDLTVLNNLNLEVGHSQKIALIGPSGSGKSTILRILMTLEAIDSGEIHIDGENVWTMTKNDRQAPASEAHLRGIRPKVGMVFQQFNLFPHMNVVRNLTEAPMRVLGLSRQEARLRAVELLKMVGLTDKMGGLSDAAFRGAKTTCCHCQGAGHATQNHAFR